VSGANDEAERLAALRAYEVLDTPPEATFDELTRLAALVTGAPMAVITFVDETRQWFKSRFGLRVTETPRELSFCAHAIAARELLIVSDARADVRFATNPLVVDAPRARFYAGAPLIMANGHAIGTLAVFDFPARELTTDQRDALVALSRQVVAQLELRRMNREGIERFELAVRATNDAVWDWNLVSNEIWWNEGMRTLFGYTPDQQPNIASWTNAIHPDDEPRVSEKLHTAITRGDQYWSDTYRFKRHDGTFADVLDRGYLIKDAAGKPVRMIGAMLDVTERRRLEDQLRQAQKMDAISQLSGGIAHDFNNLLTVIQVNAALLARHDKNPETREHTSAIVDATDRAAALTRQLLMMSRRQIMQQRVTDLNEVVAELTRMLHRTVGEHISFVAQPERSLPLVNADVGMIEQVLLNLVVNARDAMPGGGQLTIVTGHARVTEPKLRHGFDVQPGDYAFVSVSDTGSGIAPVHLPHIFEPFFTTKDIGRGTGLGLATAYGIVRQHNGWIEVTSEPGRGSTFCFYLPTTAQLLTQDRPRTGAVDEDLPSGTETILVVEDEAALRNLIVGLLETCGYTVLHTGSGVSALELWKTARERIQLLLTDVVMPGGVNGRDLAERLRADATDLPVLYTSGYSPDLTGAGERLVEGVNFLQKPYQPATLARAVRDLLDQVRRPG